jgi:hypothetical protein
MIFNYFNEKRTFTSSTISLSSFSKSSTNTLSSFASTSFTGFLGSEAMTLSTYF